MHHIQESLVPTDGIPVASNHFPAVSVGDGYFWGSRWIFLSIYKQTDIQFKQIKEHNEARKSFIFHYYMQNSQFLRITVTLNTLNRAIILRLSLFYLCVDVWFCSLFFLFCLVVYCFIFRRFFFFVCVFFFHLNFLITHNNRCFSSQP